MYGLFIFLWRRLVVLATKLLETRPDALEIEIFHCLPYDVFSGFLLIDENCHLSISSDSIPADSYIKPGAKRNRDVDDGASISCPGTEPVVRMSRRSVIARFPFCSI
jgi:hypothetical protein